MYVNYRVALRGRSKREFYSKLSIVVEETDETEAWLDLLIWSPVFLKRMMSRIYIKNAENS